MSSFTQRGDTLVCVAKGNQDCRRIKARRQLPLTRCGWAEWKDESPQRWKREQERENQKDGSLRRTWPDVAGFEDGATWPEADGCRESTAVTPTPAAQGVSGPIKLQA